MLKNRRHFLLGNKFTVNMMMHCVRSRLRVEIAWPKCDCEPELNNWPTCP